MGWVIWAIVTLLFSAFIVLCFRRDPKLYKIVFTKCRYTGTDWGIPEYNRAYQTYTAVADEYKSLFDFQESERCCFTFSEGEQGIIAYNQHGVVCAEYHGDFSGVSVREFLDSLARLD